MRIFYSPGGSDPMLLDTKAGLHALHDKLKAFVASSESTVEFAAATDRSPDPYKEFLRGLRLSKTEGATRLTLGADRWLVLEGSPTALEGCIRQFLVKEENGHQHLYTAPFSLIIEADSAWEEEVAS
jgi:hypothetical protein